jgi:hypothetical protein
MGCGSSRTLDATKIGAMPGMNGESSLDSAPKSVVDESGKPIFGE